MFILLCFSGCSSLELGDALSSEQYTQKILALGLTHEQNLIEASKLETPHLVSVVSLQLTNARDERIQYEIDKIESESFAEKVLVSEDGLKILGIEIKELIKTGVLDADFDSQSYFLEGVIDSNFGAIQHKLHLTISHNSKNNRNYLSANACDKWGRCEDLKEDGSNNKLEFQALSSNASNCSSYKCDYDENMVIHLSENLLNDLNQRDLVIKLVSQNKSHKIKISKPYLMGYMSKI